MFTTWWTMNTPLPATVSRERRETAVHSSPTSLDVLHPMPVLPIRPTRRRSRAEDTLKKIEWLRVDKAKTLGEKPKYAVDTIYTIKVYYRNAHTHSHSRIPVHGRFGRKQSIESVKPSVMRHISFDNFLQLRYDAYEIARSSHDDGLSCAFCQRVIAINTSSKITPRWTMMLFKTDKNVRRMLTAYLMEMLQLARTSNAQYCCGRDRIPRLLQIFLRCFEYA